MRLKVVSFLRNVDEHDAQVQREPQLGDLGGLEGHRAHA